VKSFLAVSGGYHFVSFVRKDCAQGLKDLFLIVYDEYSSFFHDGVDISFKRRVKQPKNLGARI